MKRHSLTKHLIPLLLAVIMLTTAFRTFAWYFVNEQSKINLSGSSVFSYFGGGDGSENDPYIIDIPKHIYNLAWLQNTGYFEEKTYFVLGDDIDMAGFLSGSDTESGAIPPIGTDAEPFLGTIDGNGHVISNLWISSDINDWKEKPSSPPAIGSSIGFFGAVSSVDGGDIGKATNFVLENLEVTSHVAGADVGLIAGYANGYLEKIGVKNGKLSFKGANTVKSEAVLVGKVGEHVNWVNRPGNSGNQLIINPTGGFTSVTSGISEVPNSTDRAYFLATLSNTASNPKIEPSGIYQHNDIIAWNGTANASDSATSGNSTLLYTNGMVTWSISPDNPDATNPANKNLINDLNKAIPYFIDLPTSLPTVAAAASQSSTVGATNGDNIRNRVSNGIYFKPTSAGICSIAIAKTNKKGPSVLSLYSFVRGADNKVPQFSEWKELVLSADKDSFRNGTAVIFNIELGDDAIGREFVIGKPRTTIDTKQANAGFIYLVLAGAGDQGGATTSPLKILNVDYAYETEAGYDILTQENYQVKNLALHFGFYSAYTTTNGTEFRFNTALESGAVKVYYDNSPPIGDKASPTVGVSSDTDSYYDPPRATTKPGSPTP